MEDKTLELIRNNKNVNDEILMAYSVGTFDIRLNSILNELFNDFLTKKQKSFKNRYKVFIHTLRHTFASNLVERGIDIYVIQRLMNHKDIKQTTRYSKASDKVKELAVRGLYD